MQISVVQYMWGDSSYFRYSQAINRYYCDLHGYRYHLSQEFPRMDRHINWHKIDVMERFLAECGEDYVLFLDADAHFYAMSLTIENELAAKLNSSDERKDILLAEDLLCESSRYAPGHPNSGIIFMRVNDFTRQFYHQWNATSDKHAEWRFKWEYAGNRLADQAALVHELYPQHRKRIFMTKEYYIMNAVYGQYIRHYAGFDNNYRAAQMQDYMQRYLPEVYSQLHGDEENS